MFQTLKLYDNLYIDSLKPWESEENSTDSLKLSSISAQQTHLLEKGKKRVEFPILNKEFKGIFQNLWKLITQISWQEIGFQA